MTSVDEYLAAVRRAMRGMDARVQQDVLSELRSHISDAAAGRNPGTALSRMEDPRKVGRQYKALYGYGRAYRAAFLGVAALLAVPSVPVLGSLEVGLAPYSLSLPLLAALAAWLLWTGVRAGDRVGLLAGLAACVTRFATLVVAALVQPGAVVTIGLALFAASSLILIPIGWLPGTAKKVWSEPRAEL